MIIEVVHYHRPNGEARPDFTQIDETLAGQYNQLTDAGLRVTSEVLMSGEVSLTLEHPGLGDYDIEIVDNVPGAPVAAVERMVSRFDVAKLATWKALQ